MDSLSYVDFIEIYENKDTIKLIGKIDTEFLKQDRIEALYYIFPLVERMVLEIYKLVPESDVEHYEQGIMRTIIALIENNNELEVLPKYVVELIQKYYDGDYGIRNRMFHVMSDEIQIEVCFNELNFLIMKLLVILKNKISEYSKIELNEIEYLKVENSN